MTTTREQAPERGRVPVAPRDRGPALAALALLLILVGVLGSALLVFRSGDRAEVLAARGDIDFGQTGTREDVLVVRAAADSDSVIEAELLDSFVNTRAITAIPAGTILNNEMFSLRDEDLVPNGAESLGIVIDASQRPAQVPRPGDVVRIYVVAGGNSDLRVDNPVIVPAARVLDTGRGAGAGTTSLTVLVRSSVAAQLANYAATGNLAVTVLPKSTEPVVDIESQQGEQE
jgi:hypothetical protein